MKKELKAALEMALEEEVPAGLGECYSRLRRLPRGEGFVHPGEIVFADTSRPTPGRFISFIPDQKRNTFTVELGWSADGRFPVASMRPSTDPETVASAAPSSGFVRLSEFYSRVGEDWGVAPIDALDLASVTRFMELELRKFDPQEALALIRPLVEDAIRKLQEYAPDFFDSLDRVTGPGSN
jgi:hypothetical protein